MTINTQSLPPHADLAALLAPVSLAEEAGRDLDGSFELSAFEMAVREPEEAPIAGVEREDERSWSAIESQARALLATSKDLRVAVQLARAQLQLHGLYGFCSAVCFVCTLTQRYWPTLYPSLDSDNDPTARINALQELVSGPVLDQLRSAAVASAPGLGPVSVKEAIGAMSGPLAASPQAASPHLTAALQALGAERLAERLEQVQAARCALAELVTFIFRETDYRPELEALTAPTGERLGLLDAIECLLARAQERLSLNAVPAPLVQESAATQANTLWVGVGSITSREDVVATLDAVCAYYKEAEPSSPVPLLLRRAQRLVPMDFFAIMRDLARQGLPEVALLAGVPAESKGESESDDSYAHDDDAD